MNNMGYILIITFAIFTFACSNTKQESKTTIEQEQEIISKKESNVIEEYSLPTIPDSITNNQQEYTDYLTNLYQNDVSFLLASSFSALDLTNSRMLIATESEFVYHPLGYNVSVDSLQSKYNNIFEVKKIECEDDYDSYHKLSYKDSYIKTIHTKYEGWECDEYIKVDEDFIICAVIANEEIQLPEEITIGMPKEDLFYKTFRLKIPLSIDTLNTSDTLGDSQIQYIFNEQKLEKVKITSNSNLADFTF